MEALRRTLERQFSEPDGEQRTRAERLRSRLWPRLRRQLDEHPRTRARLDAHTATDSELLARMRDGDAEAFDLAFARHGAALLAFAARSLPLHDAEEATQDAWLDLVEKRASLPLAVELRPYLFGFVRIAVLRALAKRVSLEALPQDLVDDAASDAILAACRKEDDERLAAALATLDVLEQELILRSLAGETGTVIATALGLTPGNERVRKHRAIRRLRRALGSAP